VITFSHTKKLIKSRFPAVPAALELWRLYRSGSPPIYLEYPVNPRPRYGWGKPPHQTLYELINSNRDAYRALLSDFASLKSGLRSISATQPNDASSPYWSNGWFTGLDALSLYALPNLFRSNLYIEIGSGNSTKFVRQSIKDNLLNTQIVSIDPDPRAEVDHLCDKLIRSRLEKADLAIFDKLGGGDILLVDGSHCCLQNSDVTIVFLEILPRLRDGVMVYFDDIYLPYDYPPEWKNRHYSEQYVLAVLLLGDARNRYEILFPGWFVCRDPELRNFAEGLWGDITQHDIPLESNGFWIRVKPTG
jgi:hypothetical protein